MSRVGKIKTVCCKNFVTYSRCEFNPSEYLNVIIGPNGTGKSTLVSAIVLSLGGEPILLARSTSIGEYVKNGCDSATVSVEVYDNNDLDDVKVTIFQRSFDIHNKSQFYVNGQPLSKKIFLEAVSRYNIQISNLCQFLPQDKVQDFAKIEPPEILNNTINSVCNMEEIENFKELKRLRNEQKNGISDHKKLLQKLDETRLRVDELKEKLERYNARKDIEEKLNVCNAKKLILESEELKKEYLECQNDHQIAKTNFKKYDHEYQAIVNKKNSIDSTTEILKKEIEEKDRNLKSAEMRKSEIIKNIELLKKKINDEKSKFEKRKRDRNEKQSELIKETKLLEVFAQDLRNLNENKDEDARRKIECERKLDQYKLQVKRLNNDLRIISNELNDSTPEIQQLKNRLKNLENETEQKMQIIKTKHPEVFEAIQWLDTNMHMFRGRVYKPLIIELIVNNQHFAKYLENTISLRDLLAFSCENTSDVSTFTTELCINKKLMLNIFHAPEPDESIFIPKIQIEQIRQYGFDGYLIDLIKGPPALLGYLCSLYNLQNIPYGSERVNSYTEQIPNDISCYFAGNMRYRSTVSKYGNRERCLTQSYIKGTGFLSSKDDQEINKIKSRLNEINPKVDLLRNKRALIESELRKTEHCVLEHIQIIKEINGKCNEFEQKSVQLRRQQRKISELKQEIVGIPDMEKDLKTFGSQHFKNIQQLQCEKLNQFEAFQKAIAYKAFSKLKMSIFKQENEELTNFIQTAKEKRESAEKRVEVIFNKCNSIKRDVKQKAIEAKSLLNNMDPSDAQFPHRNFYSSLPNSLDDLSDSIHDFSGRLDCMDNLDSEIVREYDEKRKDAESLKKQIENNEVGDQNYNTKIKSIFDGWYPKIEQIIFTINGHFSDFMQSMGYVGEVKLVKKEEFDFDTYGIEILVQYRKNVALQPLSRNVQSGGERAVAIAVYTLSMQHITHVPFRCVDEINQGMDARNERKIFEMLVDETTKTGRSQYFFVTPKLLRNLKTHKRMSVHVVYNGRMVQSQNVFTLCT
ncbi:structural maintenance of chromosomes 5 [Cochliomyia hominivorax]